MGEIQKVRHRLPHGKRLQFVLLSVEAKPYGYRVYSLEGHPGLWEKTTEDNPNAVRACVGLRSPRWLCRATEAEAELLEAMNIKEPTDAQ